MLTCIPARTAWCRYQISERQSLIVTALLCSEECRLHVLFEGKKQLHATRRVRGEFVSSKRSVQEIGESRSSHEGIARDVSERHGPIGKEALLRCFAEEHVRAFMPRVLSDHADDVQHGFLFAFEDLQEGAILVEKHARNATPSTGFACLLQHGLKLRLGEEMNGSACANYMKHPTLNSSKRIARKVSAMRFRCVHLWTDRVIVAASQGH